jgi:pyocin large subunit-like protein
MKTRVVFLIGAGALALMLAACDAGPSATSKAPQAAAGGASSPAATAQNSGGTSSGGGGQAAASTDPRDAPVPVATDGKPLWAANRKHTAEENADYQFNKNGQPALKA